jgi:hypothetical protein
MTMPLLPAPDFYGYTIFCDDIRREADGKLILIGVYGGTMLVHLPFPIILPTFGFSITFNQRRELLMPTVGLQIFLPGDPNNAPSIQAEMGEASQGTLATQTAAEVQALHPDTRNVEDESFISIITNLRFAPLAINQPGQIRVRALRGEQTIRLGALRVSPPPLTG